MAMSQFMRMEKLVDLDIINFYMRGNILALFIYNIYYNYYII